MPVSLADTTERLLDDLPPFMADSYDVQAVVDVVAREVDRIDAAKELLRANFYPQNGQDYLAIWEKTLGLAVNPLDKTLAQRQQTILANLGAVSGDASGLSWQERLDRLIGPGWTYQEYVAPTGTGATLPVTVSATDGGMPFTGAADAATALNDASTTSYISATGGSLVSYIDLTDQATFSGNALLVSVTVSATYNNDSGTQINLELLDGWTVLGSTVAGTGTGTVSFTWTPPIRLLASDTNAFRVRATGLAPGGSFARLTGLTTTFQLSGTNTGPPPHTIWITIPFVPALATPTAPTGTPATGGTMAAATYFYKVTATNFYGETLPSPASAGVVVAASGKVTLAWTAVTGASGYVVYRGASAGTVLKLATVTTNSYVDTGAVTPAGAAPTANTTQSFQVFEAQRLARGITQAHIALVFSFASSFKVGISHVGDVL